MGGWERGKEIWIEGGEGEGEMDRRGRGGRRGGRD